MYIEIIIVYYMQQVYRYKMRYFSKNVVKTMRDAIRNALIRKELGKESVK